MMTLLFFLGSALAQGEVPQEFRVKREEVFEFAQKPRVTRQGDRVEIAFAAKGACDVTVAIEDAAGKIIRYLASGVLGPNAPEPFQKNTLSQKIVWDGKDDQDRYVEEKDLTVRVSLGLKPAFERTLYWSPHKRIGPGHRPLIVPAPEGIYVHEGGGVDHVRLFDHEGNYLRTVYPFPADRLAKVDGLRWETFPQDGRKFPVRPGNVQATFLTSGDNIHDGGGSKYGTAASAMTVDAGSGALALLKRRLNRLSTDGSTGTMKREGPETCVAVQKGAYDQMSGVAPAVPRSAAFSPDGKRIYLTGFRWPRAYPATTGWLNGVARLEFGADTPLQVFAGSLDEKHASVGGTGPGEFRVPTSVACDARGRVYVSDYMNDRIQVFTPEGKFLQSLATPKPARVCVHPVSGEIYVFSWLLVNEFIKEDPKFRSTTFTRLGPLEDPRVRATGPLPLADHHPGVFMNKNGGEQHDAVLDPYAAEPTLWVVPGAAGTTSKLLIARGDALGSWEQCGFRLMVEKDGKLVERRNFSVDAARQTVRIKPPSSPSCSRQRLYVHPHTGLLYVAEGDSGVGKSFKELVEIEPGTGKIRLLPLPFTAEDMDFGPDGFIYLRTDLEVMRYEPATWREVPFDYGEEREKVGFDGNSGGKTAPAISAVPMAGTGRPGCFHLGGFAVSPKGRLVASCYNVRPLEVREPGLPDLKFAGGKAYVPRLYPGRLRWAEVHVWDQHGKVLYEDAVPGLPMTDGLAIDRDDNVYVLAAANRVVDGKEYFLERGETLMKFKPRAGKVITGKKDVPVPADGDALPRRPPDLAKGFLGEAWVEGAEWKYGGVGFGGFNSSKGGGGCACWNARFALDRFARSFAPEVDHCSVAVLDTNGNLILRVGKYGNVDDGKPSAAEGGPARTRSVGGDEVALFYAPYVATHSDRRLFIADPGNARLLSVKLDYHATEKVLLKDAPDSAPKERK